MGFRVSPPPRRAIFFPPCRHWPGSGTGTDVTWRGEEQRRGCQERRKRRSAQGGAPPPPPIPAPTTTEPSVPALRRAQTRRPTQAEGGAATGAHSTREGAPRGLPGKRATPNVRGLDRTRTEVQGLGGGGGLRSGRVQSNCEKWREIAGNCGKLRKFAGLDPQAPLRKCPCRGGTRLKGQAQGALTHGPARSRSRSPCTACRWCPAGSAPAPPALPGWSRARCTPTARGRSLPSTCPMPLQHAKGGLRRRRGGNTRIALTSTHPENRGPCAWGHTGAHGTLNASARAHHVGGAGSMA